jgi:hypothetical protein
VSVLSLCPPTKDSCRLVTPNECVEEWVDIGSYLYATEANQETPVKDLGIQPSLIASSIQETFDSRGSNSSGPSNLSLPFKACWV